MLSLITWQKWIELLASVVLFLGPGLALASFHPRRSKLDKTQTITLGFAFAVSFWAVLLAWLNSVSIRLNSSLVLAIFAIGWAVAVWRFWTAQPNAFVGSQSGEHHVNRVWLWAAVGLSLIANLLALRNVVVGPGSDTYHHTMIVQLFIDQGGIPHNYSPYADLVTFKYHFGFHAFSAALAWLSRFRLIFLTPVAAQILDVLCALSIAFLAETVTGSKRAATLGAVLCGLVMVFPAYLINWGRYTQLTGLFLLPMFLSELLSWKQATPQPKSIFSISIISAGLALSHYRLAIMAGIAALLFIASTVFGSRESSRSERKDIITAGFKALIVSGFLLLPWIDHLIFHSGQGYLPAFGRTVETTFFSLSRLGNAAITFPTNYIIIPIFIFGLIAGIVRRSYFILFIAGWEVILILLSSPAILGVYMDTVTTVITVFVMSSIICAWLLDMVLTSALHLSRGLLWIGILGITALSALGFYQITNIIRPGNEYVTVPDLHAFHWIEKNTDPRARFMINTYEFPFLPGWVVGIDGGYWLPLLTGRQTLVPPMIYTLERSSNPDLVQQLREYHRSQSDIDGVTSLDFLKANNIGYIYISRPAGQMDLDTLLSSADFKLVFDDAGVHIFEVVPQ